MNRRFEALAQPDPAAVLSRAVVRAADHLG